MQNASSPTLYVPFARVGNGQADGVRLYGARLGVVAMVFALVVATSACASSGNSGQGASISSSPPPTVTAQFDRAFMAVMPDATASDYRVAEPANGEVRAGQAFFVFHDPFQDSDLPTRCIGHAVLEADVTSGTGGGLAVYPSWPSYAADAQPGRTIGPFTVMDNRPRAEAHPTNNSRAEWDVTDLARAWWGDRALPSNNGVVPKGADLVVVVTSTDAGAWTIRVSPSPPTLRIDATCSRPSSN